MLKDCSESISSIVALVPENQYWRWNGIWTHPLRSAIFAAVFMEYLTTERLLSQDGVAEALGSESDKISRCVVLTTTKSKKNGKASSLFKQRIIYMASLPWLMS